MQERLRRLFLILLVLAQVAGVISIPIPGISPTISPTVQAAIPRDLVNHWASETVAYWMDQGVLGGFEDGTARPDDTLERAQMLAFLNRTMGYTVPGGYQFSDVPAGEWYAADFLIARQAGYFTGFENNYAYPEQEVTRAEAATLLCRIFSMTPQTGYDDLSRFSDYEVSLLVSPARSSLEAMVERGFLAGYPDNTLRPDEALTRAALMSMFSKIMPLYLNQPGINHNNNYVAVNGDAVIRRAAAELRNATVNGDLVIAPGAAEGGVNLTDVTVNGRILLLGGGNINLTNCRATDLLISKKDGRRVVVSGNNSHFERLLVQSPSDVDIDANSTLKSLIVSQEALDAKINVASDPRTVELFSPQAQVTLASSGSSSGSGSGNGTNEPVTPTPTPAPTPPTTPSSTIEVLDPTKAQVWMPTRQYTITIGSQVYIEATVYPIDADRTLTWSSSKKDVATVSDDGLVTALKEGSTTITATSKANPSLSATATINVEFRNIASITLNNTSLSIAVKKSAKLTATLFPVVGTKQPADAISWFSGDTSIATVDKNGTVKGVTVGKTTVYAYVSDVPAVQARCAVSVVTSGTLIEKLTLGRDKDTLSVGESRTYAVQAVTPTKATLQETNWWSSDTAVAMVYNVYNSKTKRTDAEVHAIYPGSFTLYTEAVDGSDIVESMQITVLPRLADDMQLNRYDYRLNVGDRVTAQAIFSPSHAASQEVYWESTHPEYVSISPSGQIWARKVTANTGISVQVVAYAASYPKSSFYKRSANVTVTGQEVQSIDFSYVSNPGSSTTSIRVPNASTREVTMIVRPTSAAEKKLIFESMDESILAVTSTGDITASLRGVSPGVTQLRVTHETSGMYKDFWVVVASRDFEQFLERLQSSTSRFSSTTQPQSFFYYNPDLEYEVACFFYNFQQNGGTLPSADKENVFYGLVNAWTSAFKDQPSERTLGGVGRMPQEAQAMSMLLRDPALIRLSLATASNDDLTVISNTLKNLWNVSEAGFDWGESGYYTKLCQYLFFDSGSNTLPPASSQAVSHILNLNHLLARTAVDPYGSYNTQTTNVKHVANFIRDNMNASGAAAVAQITKLNDTSAMRAEYARRMVFDTLKYDNGNTIEKRDELKFLGIGYLYNDLDKLCKLDKFTTHAQEILRVGVYFAKLDEYLQTQGFNIDFFLAYQTYSNLFPQKTPQEVVAAINSSGSSYRELLKDLDGSYAVFVDNLRVTELLVPFDIIRDRNNISWRPTRVALYRRNNKEPLYVQAPYITFDWVETGNFPPEDYGEFTLQIHVAPQGYDTVAILKVPVYVYGSDLETKKKLLENQLATEERITYDDLVAARMDRADKVEGSPTGQSLFMLKGVLGAEEEENSKISKGLLSYFEWYYGKITVSKIIESLEFADDLNEFWTALRRMGNDLRTKDTIIKDYKLYKFFDIYLQRWLNITINNRTLSSDFLWYPDDFLDLGALSPREYIIGLSKMEIRPGDSYQLATNPNGFRSKWPLESHRTGLFFSSSYAFANVNNTDCVGEMIERYVALCNETKPPATVTPEMNSLASQWVLDRFKATTVFSVFTYSDISSTDTDSKLIKDYIEKNLWSYLRKIDDELLPLLTLPKSSNPDIRLTVLPGIILIGSAQLYSDTDSSINGVFYRALGKPLLNIIYNLETKHDYAAKGGYWLRDGFENSWKENGSVILIDLPHFNTTLNDKLYYPLRFWPDDNSSANRDRIELGKTVFTTITSTAEASTWNDELQYLLLETLSLRGIFGYNNPTRLLPQEMGGMMLNHDGIDWKLTSDYEKRNEVLYHYEMREPLRRLWESRTLFDLWWGDMFLQSQTSRGYQLNRYQDRSGTGKAIFLPSTHSLIKSYFYPNQPSYISPNSTADADYLINGQYRLMGDDEYLVDHRSANFKLLNPPDRWFNISSSGSGDQNYEGQTLTPKRVSRFNGSRYDLPRVDLMEQIFYRHDWIGVTSYLYTATETAALDNMLVAVAGYNPDQATTKAYGSWTDWTLQEWDRIREISDASKESSLTSQTVAGLTYWEWQKLIYISDDPSYLKEFFVGYIQQETQDFSQDIEGVAGTDFAATRQKTLDALDTTTRHNNGEDEKQPLFPSPKDSFTGQAAPGYTPPKYFPALWLLNTTAQASDNHVDLEDGKHNAHRVAANNLKLIVYGSEADVLRNNLAADQDKNDLLVERILSNWAELQSAEKATYLSDMEGRTGAYQNAEPFAINSLWAYGNEAVLWRAYNEVKETDARMLNLLMHPSLSNDERTVILDAYNTPEHKRDRDAYLYRRTNPGYNRNYETAYLNYSYLYPEYDTQNTQDEIVNFVNSLGSRYGKSLAELMSVEQLPIAWRTDSTMNDFLRSFFNHDAGYQDEYGASYLDGNRSQTDPRIISIIYEEFVKDAPAFTMEKGKYSGLDFTYTYNTSPLQQKTVRLDFHDLYQRLEISRLPTIDASNMFSAELSGYKFKALHEYIEKNGSYSYIMRDGKDIYRVVTLSEKMPNNVTMYPSEALPPRDLNPLARRLENAVTQVYYRAGSLLQFSNTLSFTVNTSGSAFHFEEQDLGNSPSTIKYYPLLMFSKQAIDHRVTYKDFTISVTELSGNGHLGLSRPVHFLSYSDKKGGQYSSDDYVTNLIAVDKDPSKSSTNIFDLPELLVSAVFKDQLEDSLRSRYGISGLSSLLPGVLDPNPQVALEQLDRLLLLGYSFEDIFANSEQTLKDILTNNTFQNRQ